MRESMTPDEILALSSQIAEYGHPESALIDWKQGWNSYWHDKPNRAREWIKDISALANVRTEPDAVRRIIVGLGADGTLHDAPLPTDEADFQNLLDRVEPRPSVHIDVVRVRNHAGSVISVCVVEVRPPFDPPYVAKPQDQHVIWVRVGTKTTTASRRWLDEVYAARTNPRTAKFSASWLLADDREDGASETDWIDADVLTIRRPPPLPDAAAWSLGLSRVRAWLAEPADASQDERRQVERWCSQVERYIAALAVPVQRRRLLLRAALPHAVRFRVALWNDGTRAATEVHATLNLPESFIVAERQSDLVALVGDDLPEEPSRRPPIPTAMTRTTQALIAGFQRRAGFESATVPDFSLSILNSLHPVGPRPLDAWLDKAERCIVLTADRIQHNFGRRFVRDFLVVSITEGDADEVHELALEVHCDEWERPVAVTLRARVTNDAPQSSDEPEEDASETEGA